MRVLIYKRFVNAKICLNLIKDTDDFSRPICVFKSRLKVMDIVAEGIDIHHLVINVTVKACDLLETVGLSKEMPIVIRTNLVDNANVLNCPCISR